MTAALRDDTPCMVAMLRGAAGLVLLLVAVMLAAPLVGPYPSLLRGWLLAWAILSCAPVGGMALLLIHRLTGGDWGNAAGPALRPLAAMTPLAAIAFVPILAGLSQIYPWAAGSGQVKADIARWYLSEPWFALRSAIALAGWSVLGVSFAATAGGRLFAALGLAFFGLMISLVAVDWYLSIEPNYVATAFAAMIAVQQLLVALAVIAVIGPPDLQGKAAGDIGGLLMTTLLGVVYLQYMIYVVAWYGDLPEKAAWFLKRSSTLWTVDLILAFVLGALLPFAMLLLSSIRHSRAGLRAAGLLILAGTALHFAWLLVPAFTPEGPVIATAAVVLTVHAAAFVLFARGAAGAERQHAE